MRKVVFFVFGLIFCLPLVASAQKAPNSRFDLLKLIDPKVDANYADGSDRFSDDVPPFEQPSLWLCDDVRKKDRDQHKLDIPSSSIVFDATKRLHSSVRSRAGLTNQRLMHLGYILRLAANYAVKMDGVSKNSVEFKKLAKRNRDLTEVYQREQPVNEALSHLWRPIHAKMENLRMAVKDAVMAERNTGRERRRCAHPQNDFNLADLGMQIPWKTPEINKSYRSYGGIVPFEFTLEGFKCSQVTEAVVQSGEVTNSGIFEEAKFLEKAVLAHIMAAAQREEAYLQAELRHKFATKLDNLSLAAKLAHVLKSRPHNQAVRQKWESILFDVVALKRAIVTAEREQAKLARGINRCRLYPRDQ